MSRKKKIVQYKRKYFFLVKNISTGLFGMHHERKLFIYFPSAFHNLRLNRNVFKQVLVTHLLFYRKRGIWIMNSPRKINSLHELNLKKKQQQHDNYF